MSDLWITRYTFLSRSRPRVKFQLWFTAYGSGKGGSGSTGGQARDIYVVQILKIEGLHWLRRVGLDGEPGVTSGAPILLLETGVPVADRGIGSHLGGRGIRHQPLDLLVISRPLAQREMATEQGGGDIGSEHNCHDCRRDHPPPRRHPG